ncbi:MAG: hypothetical protein GXO79_00815 [Chlorobi bacterium]|nr:hypothetical protein [Chlorobiota bacterium]
MSNFTTHFKNYFIIVLAFVLFSCSPSHKKAKNGLEEKINAQNLVALDSTEKSFYSLPSPLQLINKLQKSGYSLNINTLNPSENYQNYTTSFKMALNFGIYATDLALLNSYSQIPESLKYFGALKYLAEKLDLTVFLTQNVLKRTEQNIANNDSLFYMLAHSLKNINYYLKTNERSEIASLILTGGWIESIHFLLNNLQTENDSLIMNLLASQKYSAENVNKILSHYNYDSEDYRLLIKNLEQLSIIYKGVPEEYTFKDANVDIHKKITVINSTSTYLMSDSLIQALDRQVTKLRLNIISD